MDNQSLKAFVTVAESGSFSLAAEQLHLTQSAVSKRIANLEHQTGKKLFDRIARQISLTEAGNALLPRAHIYFKNMLQQFRLSMIYPAIPMVFYTSLLAIILGFTAYHQSLKHSRANTLVYT